MMFNPMYFYFISFFIASVFSLSASLDCFAYVNPHMTLTKVSFNDLRGWESDDHTKAFQAFKQSCIEIAGRDPKTYSSPLLQYASTQQWQTACKAARKIHQTDPVATRRFFESWFEPYRLTDNSQSEGLFTGYYLPMIEASLQPSKRFYVPIHALPQDLVKVDLGMFRPELTGKSIVGQVRDNRLSPYPNRAGITTGAMKANADVLAWSDNPIDVYFAQVQGSALVQFPDRQRVVIGYAGDNGHQYTAIGKILIARGELSRERVSMQSIRTWLEQHPKQADALLNENHSYVFFRILKDNQPLGTEKVGLTPERSLAVDNRYIPFGAPIWIQTSIPAYQSEHNLVPFRHLVIAQDTGGAIKGVVRGDIYWGTGSRAEFIAGQMNHTGQSWILLPRKL